MLFFLVDYILFIKADVDLDVNVNEVRDTRYVSADELRAMFAQQQQNRQQQQRKAEHGTDGGGMAPPLDDGSVIKFTPWFQLICDTALFQWWQSLRQNGSVEQFTGETAIRRML
jgi:isopentenyl-diphosphate delta-isomerase